MNHKEFTQKCTSRGFINKNQCFFRCIGDGIYQTIRINETCYVDPTSPYYSLKNRRTKRIAIGLYSIYARLPELWFDPKIGAGLIDANNLVGRRNLPFFGLQDHYEIMENSGFVFLDRVNTHRNLIQAIETLREYNPSLVMSQEMCIPYLICEEKEKANQIISSFFQNEKILKWCSETYDGDFKREIKYRVLQEWQELKMLIFEDGMLTDYMRDNMYRNIKNAENQGIYLAGQFDPLV